MLGIVPFGGDNKAPQFQIRGVDTDVASCADQKSPNRRISGVSLSGATRLVGCASGRLTKLLGKEDRCNGLRRQSAPVHSSADIDAPVWPGAVSSAAEPGKSAAQPQHTAPMTVCGEDPGVDQGPAPGRRLPKCVQEGKAPHMGCCARSV